MNSHTRLGSERENERGIALILTLFIVLAASVLAASLMILNQTETYGAMNYRMMTQARYGAEAGLQKTVNYLLNSYPSVQPGTATDPTIANYDMTVSPVTYLGQPVVLSALSGTTANYPIASVQTAFNAAASGTLTVGNSGVSYATAAKLISMQQVGSGVVQTWEITSDGTMSGSQSATEEMTATLETVVIPSNGFAAFAVSSRCGAMSFSGGATTDSYDSSAYSGSGAVTAANGGLMTSGGDVGTNGNLTQSGGVTIKGTLYTPRTGVGVCSNGGGGIADDALTQSGGATVTGGLSQLPQNYLPTPPTITTPSPAPPTTNLNITGGTTCATLSASLPSGATCSKSGLAFTITPNGQTISLGSVSVSGGASIVFNAGTYNMNSFNLSGGTGATFAGTVALTLMTSISLSGNSAFNVPATGSVTLNIVTSSSTTPINLSGGVITNASLNPTKLQINYAGGNSDPTSAAGPNPSVSLSGGTAMAMVLNAPYAALVTSGNSDLYGSFVVKTLTDSGGAKFHYDRHLTSGFNSTAGSPMLTSFSWKRF